MSAVFEDGVDLAEVARLLDDLDNNGRNTLRKGVNPEEGEIPPSPLLDGPFMAVLWELRCRLS